MTTAPNNAHATATAPSRTPAAVRLAIGTGALFGLGGALYLWTERGPALLLDLAHMGAKFLCL